MSHPKSKPTNWASLLQRAMNESRALPPGDGWEKFEAIKKKLGLGESKARRVLQQHVSAGTIEVFNGTDTNNSGRLIRQVWYREVRK